MGKVEPKNIVMQDDLVVEEGSTPDFTNLEELKAYTGPLTQKLESAYDFRNQIIERQKEELVNIDEQISKIISVLKILGAQEIPKDPKRPRKSQKKPSPLRGKKQPSHIGVTRASGTATGFGISLESAGQAADFIRKMVKDRREKGEDETFTQKDAYKVMDWDQSKGSQAFRYLAHIGFLTEAGRSSHTRAVMWRIMNDAAIDKAFEESEKKTKAYMESASEV